MIRITPMTRYRSMATAIPPVKKQAAVIMLARESWIDPLIPCPLVHPPAHRAPKPSRIPPGRAMMMRRTALSPNTDPQSAGTQTIWKVPERKDDRNAPMMIPGMIMNAQSTCGTISW